MCNDLIAQLPWNTKGFLCKRQHQAQVIVVNVVMVASKECCKRGHFCFTIDDCIAQQQEGWLIAYQLKKLS